MALRFCIPIQEIAISRSGPSQGYIRIAPIGMSLATITKKHLPELERALLVRHAEHRIMVLFAGALAEAKLLGSKLRAYNGQSDLSNCLAACCFVAALQGPSACTLSTVKPAEKPTEVANRLRVRARQILGNPGVWRAVTTLAEEIEGWSWLTGHEAATTVQWSRRITNQLGLLLPIPDQTRRDAGARAA